MAVSLLNEMMGQETGYGSNKKGVSQKMGYFNSISNFKCWVHVMWTSVRVGGEYFVDGKGIFGCKVKWRVDVNYISK